ncbi:class I SAM-dependent methyltransferase [Undibacterium flavidum]|uniref:Methyltransferase domain-containing protein n=1 Tax=Undibacterium flavidum TaxID=2762297 RepID=A0ABR6Y913_9BURK|nr:class I SAM-dependent methyltransferase [Undibacterium flavidum]MBC3873060.1 methyltransferase domain-containing protein [Undibacterium flavidum]
MKTQQQLDAEDALIRQRIQSNVEGTRKLGLEQGSASDEIEVNIFAQKPLFPPSPENLHCALPQEQPGKVWPRGFMPYLQARVATLFDTSLALKTRLRSLPVIGYGFGWLNALLRLPLTRYRHTVAIDVLRQQNNLLHAQIQSLNHRISLLEPYTDSMSQRTDQLEAVQSAARLRHLENFDIGNRLMQLEQLETARKFKQLTHLINVVQRAYPQAQFQEQTQDQLSNTQYHQQILQRLDVLEKMVRVQSYVPTDDNTYESQHGAERPAAQPTDDVTDKPDLAAFYLEFEEQFRGMRADIKRRQEVYLPYLDEILGQAAENRKLFVDVGCGRGEWLELLSESGIPAIGIDSNTSMVEACLQKGYAAKVADGIAFLREQEKSSLSGVSGFHIIEHLPFEALIALFDAAYAALSDGGLLIFETPNPENLIIGACNFHFDPTHLKPIVPEVAQFIAKQRGFRQVEIKRLHPFPEGAHMTDGSQVAQTLNKFLFSEQDYAVIARK